MTTTSFTLTKVDDINTSGWDQPLGGRHAVRTANGDLYSVQLRTNTGTGYDALYCIRFTVDASGTLVYVARYLVVDFGLNMTTGQWITCAMDVSNTAGTERLLVIHTLPSFNDKIYLKSMNTSAPGAFTSRDNFNIENYALYTGIVRGYQIIGDSGSDVIHAIYMRNLQIGASGSLIRHRTLAGVGLTWSAAASIETAQIQPQWTWAVRKCLSAARGPSGDIHIAFAYQLSSAPGTTNVFYAKWSSGSGWTTPVSIWSCTHSNQSVPYGQADAHALSLCVDRNEHVHVVWKNDEFISEVYQGSRGVYAYYDGAAWTIDYPWRYEQMLPNNYCQYANDMSIGTDNAGSPKIWVNADGFGRNSVRHITHAHHDGSSWYVRTVHVPESSWDRIVSVPHSFTDDGDISSVAAGGFAVFQNGNDVELTCAMSNDFALGLQIPASSDVSVASDGEHNFIDVDVQTNVTVTQDYAIGIGIIIEVSAETTASVTQTGAKTILGSGSHAVSVAHAATYVYDPPGGASTVVHVTSAVDVTRAQRVYAGNEIGVAQVADTNTRVSTTATVTQDVNCDKTAWNLSASNSVTVGNNGVGVLPGLCETWYVPDPDVPDDPDSLLVVIFSGPVSAPTIQMQMKRPDFGDQREIVRKDRTARARSGKRYVYHQDAMTHRLAMTWIDLSRRQALEFENFFVTLRGQLISYTDYNNHTWSVYSLDPPVITSEGPEQNTVSITLEGALA